MTPTPDPKALLPCTLGENCPLCGGDLETGHTNACYFLKKNQKTVAAKKWLKEFYTIERRAKAQT